MSRLRKIGLVLALTLSLAVGVVVWVRDPVRLRPGEHRGIDVSAHQGEINWPRVAAAGIKFAYIKATEGGDWVDERFQANWDGAGAAGIKRGAYHFFTLGRPGADQAANFLAVAPPRSDSLPPAVDLEFGGNTGARPSREMVVQQLSVFLERVETAYHRTAVLYVLPEFESRYAVRDSGRREIWLRNLLARPPANASWRIWQYSAWGSVPGIQGGVDLNVAHRLWD